MNVKFGYDSGKLLGYVTFKTKLNDLVGIRL